jgi:hypothetical protein
METNYIPKGRRGVLHTFENQYSTVITLLVEKDKNIPSFVSPANDSLKVTVDAKLTDIFNKFSLSIHHSHLRLLH